VALSLAKYPIEVFWSDEDEGYIAVVSDLAGCNAWGKTEADAIREAHDAIVAWVKAARSMKRAFPVLPEPPIHSECGNQKKAPRH